MSFVHLHSHTSYSLLDGAGRIEKMVAEAKRLGMDALAITDHGNMFGTLDFYTQAKKQGIKPIIGCEAYVAPAARTLHRSVENESYSYHLVLLAKNETGFRNLIKLTSASYLEGFYYRPRIDKELLQQYSEGLVVLSACMKGEIAYKLRRGRKDEAIKTAEFLLETFGDDFYFEIQDHQIPEEHATYPLVYDLARDMGVPVVATNDVHYLHKKDSAAHDILLCLQTGKDRDDPDRMRYNTQELYLKSPEEMYKLFKDRPDVVERTLEVAEKINLEIDFNQRLLPEFPIPESEGTRDADEYLEKLSRRGLEKKMKNINSDVMKRLEYELSVIRKMGFAGYFLIVQDFIDAARQKDIPVGLGRGSAAGSLVAYTLGITDVDPIKYDLLFERFLNPERVTMPDIDVDFCYERRDEVIEYVREKYGRRNVAQIITFGTMLSRGVIRDVSRVLKIPIPKADQIAKQIPVKQGKPMRLEEAFDTIPELKEMAESDDAQIRELMEYSMTLEGISRHTSVHAAGVIIAPDDITNYVPLSTDSDKNITTQWTMGGCESIGLLKMDFLGLRNLTVIHNTEKMIRKKHDPDFSIENISMEDEKTFELFGEGNTVGVFQFESSGMQEYLRKLKPNRIEDLLAMNALYRPGPMDMIDDFIDRKKGRKEIVYLHPKLEPILKETYGIIVYQEQVMRISSDLGGFSLAEADSMRRIMGKKKIEAMVEQKQKLIAGCVANGIDKKVASEIADMIEKFASYGFNKSHSAAYAIIAYQTAYLKSNYPAEFMSANLSSFMSTPDKVVIMLDECRRMGLEVVPPDVNYSGRRFEPIDDTHIAFGMEAIKNVGGNAIESIVAGRELVGGKYENIFQMLQNVDLRLVNKKVLESLAECGAMDSMHKNRAQLFGVIETAINFAQDFQSKEKANRDQWSLFDVSDEVEDVINYPEMPESDDWSEQDKLKREKELIGFYISGHPLQRYRPIIDLYSTNFDLPEGEEIKENTVVSIAGSVSDMRTMQDRRGNTMAFVKLEDFHRQYEAVVFGSVYPNVREKLRVGNPVLIKGRMNSSSQDSVIKVICEDTIELDNVPKLLTGALMLHIRRDKLSEEKIAYLKNILKSHPGESALYFRISNNGSVDYNMISRTVKVAVSMALLQELNKLVGWENIRIKLK